MNNPKIDIPLNWIDKFIEIIGLIGLLILIALPVIYYKILPETIPRHFDIYGNPNRFGHKTVLWLLPIIGTVLYIGMTFLNKYPHKINHPYRITKENAEQQYKSATKMIRILKASIVVFFAFITYFTIQISLDNQTKIDGYLIYGYVIFILIFVVSYVLKSLKVK